jgi:hypothetical protein
VKSGWNEVARLGPEPERYPHILVDKHGWCLRLGRGGGDEKYYSSLPTLLQGLVEHVERRHPQDAPLLLAANAMLVEIRAAYELAFEYGRRLAAAMGQELPISRFQPAVTASPEPSLFPPANAA